MLVSQLKIGDKFKLKTTAHNTVGGFIYKIKPDETIYQVEKVNKTSIKVIGLNNKEYCFKFKGTDHWRSTGADSLVELV